MVLKRKRGNEWVTVNTGQAGSSSQPSLDNEPELPNPTTKRARRALPVGWVDEALDSDPEPEPVKQTARKSKGKAATKNVEPPVMAPPPFVYSEPGPSSLTSAPTQFQKVAPAKRGRKKKDPNEPVVEKRLAKLKSHCPQNIMDRLDRVRTQTFFMVDRRRHGGELREEFSVLGSTGNIYTVAIDKLPSCDCPDHRKGNHCKHILFVMTKVLQVPNSSNLWYQKALLTPELQEIFDNAPAAPNAVTNRRVQEAYARATGKANAGSDAAPAKGRRMPQEENDCPICYETMHKVPEAKLSFCEECGNALHNACFSQWKQSNQRSGKELTCVYCRSKWLSPSAASGSGPVKPGGYLNLAGVAGISPQRDTSSYYHGFRRGFRGGYTYDDGD